MILIDRGKTPFFLGPHNTAYSQKAFVASRQFTFIAKTPSRYGHLPECDRIQRHQSYLASSDNSARQRDIGHARDLVGVLWIVEICPFRDLRHYDHRCPVKVIGDQISPQSGVAFRNEQSYLPLSDHRCPQAINGSGRCPLHLFDSDLPGFPKPVADGCHPRGLRGPSSGRL